MAYPKHPKNILIKNKYYPNGLNEISNWTYYQKNKFNILKETRFKNLMLFIATDENTYTVKRKGTTTNYVRLNPQNYDSIIHPRVISIHSTMKAYEDIAIIDIDIDNISLAKRATKEIYEYIQNNKSFIIDSKIRFTGKTSFHIFCKLDNKYPIDMIRKNLQYFLSKNINIINSYTLNLGKRKPGIPNIDLSSNKYLGGYITLHSLSVIGLKCMEIKYSELSSFRPNQTKIDLL